MTQNHDGALGSPSPRGGTTARSGVSRCPVWRTQAPPGNLGPSGQQRQVRSRRPCGCCSGATLGCWAAQAACPLDFKVPRKGAVLAEAQEDRVMVTCRLGLGVLTLS